MARRKAWHGRPPASPAEARRRLLDAARACVQRLGQAKAGLTDVAQEAGVTRQTVYRYFEDADDLFRSAAALSSGGFLERLRARVGQETGLVDRIVECMVFAITELPADPHLAGLTAGHDALRLEFLLGLGFVQEETLLLAGEGVELDREALDGLAELLLRLLHSFLADPGPARTEAELRAFLRAWLGPALEVVLDRSHRGARID